MIFYVNLKGKIMALFYSSSWLDGKRTLSHDEGNMVYSDTTYINPLGFAVDIGPHSSV